MPEWVWPSLFTFVIGVVYAGYRNMVAREALMKGDISKLQADLRAAETKIEPFWAKGVRKMAEDLHGDDTPELDELMTEAFKGTIAAARRSRLNEMLLEITHNPKASQDRKDSAGAMIIMMRKALVESAALKQ